MKWQGFARWFFIVVGFSILVFGPFINHKNIVQPKGSNCGCATICSEHYMTCGTEACMREHGI